MPLTVRCASSMAVCSMLPLGREPVAVVDHLGVARDERVAQVQHLAVERQRLDGAVRGVQDRAARASRRRRATSCRRSGSPPDRRGRCRARPPIALSRASSVAGDRRSPLTATGSPRLEVDLDVLRLVRRLLRRHGQQEHVLVRLAPRILEDAAFVADVQQVAVGAVRLLAPSPGSGCSCCSA